LYPKATPQPADLLQCRAGDPLVAGRGLTSARSQTFGAVARPGAHNRVAIALREKLENNKPGDRS
jgi:hypothetical protein